VFIAVMGPPGQGSIVRRSKDGNESFSRRPGWPFGLLPVRMGTFMLRMPLDLIAPNKLTAALLLANPARKRLLERLLEELEQAIEKKVKLADDDKKKDGCDTENGPCPDSPSALQGTKLETSVPFHDTRGLVWKL
jgi:hypothetical protein